MNVRKKRSDYLRPFTESTRTTIRLLVSVRRQVGTKARQAIGDVAFAIGLSAEQTSKLFYDHPKAGAITREEWMEIRQKAAAILLRDAAELRRRAAEYERKALELKYAPQPTLFGSEEVCSVVCVPRGWQS